MHAADATGIECLLIQRYTTDYQLKPALLQVRTFRLGLDMQQGLAPNIGLEELQRHFLPRLTDLRVLSLEARLCHGLFCEQHLRHLSLHVRWAPAYLSWLLHLLCPVMIANMLCKQAVWCITINCLPFGCMQGDPGSAEHPQASPAGPSGEPVPGAVARFRGVG